MNRHLVTLTAGTFVTWTGQRITAVALPLVALYETGDAWTTGLVGGMAGLPLVTSAWWGRSLRGRLTSGRSLSLLLAVQVAGLVLVPIAAWVGSVTAPVLCIAGLITGACSALLSPAQRALTADLADGIGPGVGPKALSWQDFAHRVSMIFAPPLGAWLLITWGAEPLLWCEAAAVALTALALLTVPAAAATDRATGAADAAGRSAEPVTIRSVLTDPMLAVGIGLAGIGGLTWFGFTLGLALLGEQVGRPGELIAAGMSGYGVATVTVSLLLPVIINRVPRMPAILASWAIFGLSYLVLPVAAPNLAAIAVVSAVGGATMPLGIAALNALITERTTGERRRAAFTAETVLHSGGASVGLLVGGAVIGAFGAGSVLIVAGLFKIIAVIAAGCWLRLGATGSAGGERQLGVHVGRADVR